MPNALALTFDNLGEAADLERGLWPADRPLGRHPSVTTALPRLLDELDALELRATFCVEALNCELYPAAIADIAARGHELALHGWRHEAWATLPGDREDELLDRGRRAFSALGVDVRGFRPPGGELTAQSPQRLAAHGFRWCSPAGGPVGVRARLAYVPFRWERVDAYHVLTSFAALRERRGGRGEAVDYAAAARRLLGGLEAEGEPAGPVTLVLHPFLMTPEPAWRAARRVLGRIAELRDGGSRRVVPVGEIATGLAADRG